MSSRALPALRVVRAALGVGLAVRPEAVVGVARTGGCDQRCRRVARALGVRHLVASAAATNRRRARGAAVVDAVHAATMVVLALVDERRRAVAVIDAALASGLAWAGLAFTSDPGGPTP